MEELLHLCHLSGLFRSFVKLSRIENIFVKPWVTSFIKGIKEDGAPQSLNGIMLRQKFPIEVVTVVLSLLSRCIST